MSDTQQANVASPPSYSPRRDSPSVPYDQAQTSKTSAYHGIPGDPLVQVETVITRTTIYSQRTSPKPPIPPQITNIPMNTSLQFPGTSGLSNVIPNMSAGLVKRAVYPVIDKDLPRIPPEDAQRPSNDSTASHSSTTFTTHSFHEPSSTAFLAHAALRLGSPAIGLAFERPAQIRASSDAPSVRTSTAVPGRSPTDLEPMNTSLPSGHFPSSVSLPYLDDKPKSSTIGAGPRSRKVTFLPEMGTPLPASTSLDSDSSVARPRPANQSRGLFRSRSMYSRADNVTVSSSEPSLRVVRTHSKTAPSPEPLEEPEEAINANIQASKSFWRSPFRGGTIRSTPRRPRTSDGVESSKLPERRLSVAQSNFPDLLAPSPVSSAVSSMSEARLSAEIPNPAGLTPPTIGVRRIASASRLVPPEEKATRRRSMSLFQRKLPENPQILETPSTPSRSPLRPPAQNPFAPKPTLLRKLSMSLLSSSNASNTPSPSSLVPAHPPSRKNSSDEHRAEALRSLSIELVGNGEGPKDYLRRMMHTVNPVEIAGILAASKEPFMADALKVYMERFEFSYIPLDIALRRLLLDAKLPQETQQIDRLIGAFASRYETCNPGLFTAADTAYILAYSLVLLHSDFFNKANKTKMQKAAYVKNTRLPGVLPVVLEYFYDNITTQPFRRSIEHPEDFEPPTTPDSFTMPSSDKGVTIASSSSNKVRKGDLYYFIEQNQLDLLRVNVEARVPPLSPFRASFSSGFQTLRVAFGNGIEARLLAPGRKKSLPIVGTSVRPDDSTTQSDLFRIVKAALVKRREDFLLGNQKSINRKWRSMTVVLTTSQILFFRGTSLLDLIDQHLELHLFDSPLEFSIEPEDIISLENAFSTQELGTVDEDTFRFVTPSKHQYLLQFNTSSEAEEWLSLLNYASAFRTSGLQMRLRRQLPNLPPKLPSLPKLSSGSDGLERCNQEDRPQSQESLRIVPPSPSIHSHPRSAVTRTKLQEAYIQLERAQIALDSEMRRVRNLAILTPVLKSTREHVDTELEPVARRVKQLRLQILRLECEHEVLHSDLVAFEQEIAANYSGQETERSGVSKLVLPESGNLLEAPSPDTIRRPESSSGSYYSAVDDG